MLDFESHKVVRFIWLKSSFQNPTFYSIPTIQRLSITCIFFGISYVSNRQRIFKGIFPKSLRPKINLEPGLILWLIFGFIFWILRLYHGCKVHIFWEGFKTLQNLHLTFDWHYISRTKVRWRFHKILWPSQNIWTLIR